MALNIRPGGTYLDATYGRGGHSRGIAGRLAGSGRLIAMDRDPDAVAHARSHPPAGPDCVAVHAPFAGLRRALAGVMEEPLVDGILADLGVSSPQLDDPGRGFSFSHDGPLDMRMDTGAGMSARDWLEDAGEAELKRVIRTYGEEKFAARIARAIVGARREKPIESTRALAEIVAAAVPEREREPGRHPATRTFQAIRMHVNEELEQLRAFLPQAVECLAAAGRLVVISFHSLEDRIVKRFLRDEARGDPYPSDLPVASAELKPRLRLVGKPVRPSAPEVEANRRARSAVMRVAERTEAAYA